MTSAESEHMLAKRAAGMRPLFYRGYMLTILTVTLAFSYVDRMVFGVVLDYVRRDLQLTDTQMGILNGVCYFFFFSLVGIPLARWADRGDRVRLLSLTTAVWSIAVALCGFAGNFVQMVLPRIGVAAGEAGCFPAASSLIPDYFTRAERPRASARYLVGVSLGVMAGYFAGGWLNELYGWRTTFVVVGLPGLALAAIAWLTLREPRRDPQQLSVAISKQPLAVNRFSMTVVLRILWNNSTYRSLLLFYMVWYICGWGLQQWLPTFFLRSHAMASGELGTWLAVAYGASGLLGAWLGGEWASRYAAHNERVQLQCAAVLFSLEGLSYAGALLLPGQIAALAAVAMANFCEQMAIGPIFATFQTIVPSRMRAIAQSMAMVLPILFGASLGPFAAGAMSDAFRSWSGNESLRWSLLALCPLFVGAAWQLLRASKTVGKDVGRVVDAELTA